MRALLALALFLAMMPQGQAQSAYSPSMYLDGCSVAAHGEGVYEFDCNLSGSSFAAALAAFKAGASPLGSERRNVPRNIASFSWAYVPQMGAKGANIVGIVIVNE